MSLFKARDWWSTMLGEKEEFDQGCLCLADVDNSGNGQDKIIVGSFMGYLRIFNPHPVKTGDGTQAEDLLLEVHLRDPVLQVEVGKFVSGTEMLHLAVLHSRKLCVYSVSGTLGNVEHGNQYHIKLIYEHSLQRTACNMAYGPFGGVKVFRNGSSSFPSFQCSWTQKNMPPSFVVPQSPLSVVSSHWPSFPMSYPSDGFINRKGMKATQSLEQAGNTHREQGFPSQACWTSYGDGSFLTPENTPRRADEASSLVQAMQSQGMRPPNHSLFNDIPVSFASERGEVRLDRGSPFPAREHEGTHAPLKCGHDIDEPGARLLGEQYNEVLGIKDTMKTSAAEEINLFKERNGYGPVPRFLSPPAKVIPEIQLVKSQNNVRPEVCKSTDVSQFLPLRQLSSSISGEDPRLPFLTPKNLSEPGFPESHYFLLTQLAKGSKVDKALQFDSRETEKQHSTGRELSSYDLEPKRKPSDREPEAFAITPKGKVMYLLKRNARPEDLEGKVEGDVKDDDVYEIVCFHEVREQGRLILHKGSLYQEVGKVISSKSPQHSITQGSTPVTSKMKGEEESEITCGGSQKKPATALQADTAVQCGVSCAGGAPELYEESDVQDEYEHLSDDASTKSLSC